MIGSYYIVVQAVDTVSVISGVDNHAGWLKHEGLLKAVFSAQGRRLVSP